jgi:hypothetical protein
VRRKAGSCQAKEENDSVKLRSSFYAIFFPAFLCISSASAQSSFDVNIGGGTAHSSASGAGIENTSSLNAFGSCTPSATDPTCERTPSLGGFFLGFGGDLLLWKHFGVGAEVMFQPAKSDYGPLQYRQTFYDFNGIFVPVNQKKFQLQLQGGIGGAKTSFSFTQTGCVGTAVCTTQTEPVGNTSHFQLHVGVGLQVFLTEHIFVRPQFDLHYVPSFTDQFGSNTVPAGMVWVGYSWGDH